MKDVAEVLLEAERLLIEIRKCVSLYHYCEDGKIIYNHILKDIYTLNKPEILIDFSLDYFNEDSNITTLKVELLKLYKVLSNNFLTLINDYCDLKYLVC